MVTPTRNLCSASVHTHTHTHREHTPGAVGSQCCSARGAVWGLVPWLRAPVERVLYIHFPPTYNSCRTWDSNSQSLDYESDSLTLGHDSPTSPHIVTVHKLFICQMTVILCKYVTGTEELRWAVPQKLCCLYSVLLWIVIIVLRSHWFDGMWVIPCWRKAARELPSQVELLAARFWLQKMNAKLMQLNRLD